MLPNTIKTLRTKNNLSQEKLGQLLSVSQQAVGKWEKGIAEPDSFTLQKLADIFEVSVDYLLGRTESIEALSNALSINKEPTSREEVSSKLKNAMAVVGLKPCDLDTLSEEQIELVVGFAQQLIDKHKK